MTVNSTGRKGVTLRIKTEAIDKTAATLTIKFGNVVTRSEIIRAAIALGMTNQAELEKMVTRNRSAL